MKKVFFLIAFCLATSLPVPACLNDYYTLDKKGKPHPYGKPFAFAFNKNFDKEFIVKELGELERRMKIEHTYMLLSDYAVCLLKLGKTKEALELFVPLSNHYPDEYQIASNLGTAYELNGQVDSALKYIKRGMELYPDDHSGSEWIHVKILETKLKLTSDPDWLNTHTILQLSSQQKQNSVSIIHQLTIQLMERFPFSSGPNVIVAQLLIELGDLYTTTSIEFAKVCYVTAKEYCGNNSVSLENKIREMESLIKKYDSKNPDGTERGRRNNVRWASMVYQSILIDKDKMHYQIDWSQINTDVKSLLAEVDLTLPVVEAWKMAGKQTDTLELTSVKTDSITKPVVIAHERNAESSKWKNMWVYFLASLFSLSAIFYFTRRK
jgi:tetratricopeptide (TPR) repeat protein